ncbi:MAG: PAS domain-containing protein [Chthoniobacteraceae bacterium]
MNHRKSDRHPIVLIEDDPAVVARLREIIESDTLERFTLQGVSDSLAEGLTLIEEGVTALLLLDLHLRDSVGLPTLTTAHAAEPFLPIIVLSESDDEELGAQAVHHGAQDYLLKGSITPQLLMRAMRYAIERVAAEAELAHERDLLNTLLENIPDRIYFKDRQSRFIRINRALTELLRLSTAGEAYGKSDADFYDEAHASAARADEYHVMESGQPLLGKVEFETLADGRRSWSLTTKIPLRDHSGRVTGTCGISREISDLKELEIRLAAERNLLRSVIDNIPDMIFLKDLDGIYTLDNMAHWRSLGARGPDEVIGRTSFDFFPDELAKQFQEADQEVVESGETVQNIEQRTLNPRREPRWMLTTKVPWRDEHNELLGVLCIARDITEQKEAAEGLEQANRSLAQSQQDVLQKMRELQAAHQELRAVQLQLIEAEKMKSIGRLSAGVAHEVKNPLAIIRMAVELLRANGHEDPTSAEAFGEIDHAVNRADLVIRGLLDFSAPKEVQLAAVDINDIIQDALRLVRGDLRRMKLEMELKPGLPALKLDSGKMGQVFVNLFTNAIHSMDSSGTLTVRTFVRQLTRLGAQAGDSRNDTSQFGKNVVVCEIDDTGHGIPEEKLPRIFEPFFTTKPTGKGTGLGLSVVRTIIDLHGGTIDVRNLPEGGVRVTIMLRVS